MKKKITGFIIFMICAVCMGCSQKTAKAERETGSIFDMQKSQEVVICDAEGNQLADITDARKIDDFTDKLNIDEWKISEDRRDAVFCIRSGCIMTKLQDKKQS